MKPTMELRWVLPTPTHTLTNEHAFTHSFSRTVQAEMARGRLQQKWEEIEYFTISTPQLQTEIKERKTGKFEWRDIPTVMEGTL